MLVRPNWWVHAVCLGMGTELFFGAEGHETVTHRKKREREAKLVCSRCDVKIECLADALKFSDDGVRGGMTRYERQQTAPQAIVVGEWMLIATSAAPNGQCILERRDSIDNETPPMFRVMKSKRVLKQTTDEKEAWIALYNSEL